MQEDGNKLLVSRSGILFVSGFATSLRVERGHLLVRTGSGRRIREGRFAKVSKPRIERLVVFGKGGFATFEALSWLQGVGASFLFISRSGRIIAASGEVGTKIPALRRAQARAPEDVTGLEVGSYLVEEKLSGQQRVLGEYFPDVCGVADARAKLAAAATLNELRLIEAQGAAVYWGAWSGVRARFARRDTDRVPDHWLAFGSRSSLLSGSPRKATTPASAILNYLYRLVEFECRVGLLSLGLDPALGICHADQPARDSLALDAMEPIRPDVDSYVLRLLSERTFSARDFSEAPSGAVRISSGLAAELAATLPAWERASAPVCEQIARMLGAPSGIRVPTKLTQDARSSGRSGIRRGKRKLPAVPAPRNRSCQTCGALVVGKRTFCDGCLPERRAQVAEAFQGSGPAAIARLQSQGDNPSSRPSAKRKLARSIAENRKAAAAWEKAHPGDADPGIFDREILPGLSGVPLSRIMGAAGISVRYASLIRRGSKRPHPRHWEALRALAPERVGR